MKLMYRRSTRQRLMLAALLAVTATVVTLDFRANPGGPIRRVQDAALSVVAPLQDGIARVFRPVGDFLGSLSQIGGLSEQNRQLQARVRELETNQRRFPELVRENERLLSLMAEKDWTAGATVGARVIGLAPSNLEWSVIIDKGANDGVTAGMAVVSSEGLVGRVVQVTGGNSKVLLIIDPDHSVGARLTGSGETGVVTGRGRDELRFDLIDPEVEVARDETVVTSGYDRGIYPPGIPIGLVTRTTAAPSGLEKGAFVRPFVDFSRLDFLLVLLESGPREEGV